MQSALLLSASNLGRASTIYLWPSMTPAQGRLRSLVQGGPDNRGSIGNTTGTNPGGSHSKSIFLHVAP